MTNCLLLWRSLWNSKAVAEEVLFHSPVSALSVRYLTVRFLSACLTARNGCWGAAGIWHSSCGSEAGGAKKCAPHAAVALPCRGLDIVIDIRPMGLDSQWLSHSFCPFRRS